MFLTCRLNGLYYYDDYIIYDEVFNLQPEGNMNTKSKNPLAEKKANLLPGILMRAGTVLIFLVLIAAILFLASGQPTWIWAWIYLGISVVVVLINGFIMLRTNPETVAERGRPKETKNWDKIIAGPLALTQYLILPLVAGLDLRFDWTQVFSVAWHITGVVVTVVGIAFTSWAMIENAYFSTAVRIQSERGHTVCRTGPYRFVRHPGYVGFILQALSFPILLGSLWALIPGVISMILIGIRTYLEDSTLKAELPGYQDYMQAVRYRLLPGIW
jgi:protein-S-isoprenylcysteine O-methyltransferase Ste14